MTLVKKLTSNPRSSGIVFVACLLSFNIVITPMAAMAVSINQRSEVKGQKSEQATAARDDARTNAAANDVFVNPPAPEPGSRPVCGSIVTAGGVTITSRAA